MRSYCMLSKKYSTIGTKKHMLAKFYLLQCTFSGHFIKLLGHNFFRQGQDVPRVENKYIDRVCGMIGGAK